MATGRWWGMMRSWRGQAEGWEAKIRRSWDNAYSAMSSYMSGSSNSSRGQTAQIPFMVLTPPPPINLLFLKTSVCIRSHTDHRPDEAGTG